jgi:hypothetical protein
LSTGATEIHGGIEGQEELLTEMWRPDLPSHRPTDKPLLKRLAA